MSLGLESLAPCFQGIIPALFFTCAKDGTPNVAYLSHVDYVDARHVALSFQFFNKSRRNIAENPHALVHVTDPDTQQGWSLRLRFVRSETEGAIFERMALRIEAIASYSGLKGIFKLLAADIYEVTAVAPIAQEPGYPESGDAERDRRAGADAVFTMKALQDVSQRIHSARSLEALLDSILASLEESFGFSHSMILLAGEEPGVLHDSQVKQILEKPHSYRKNDLAIFDFDRCIIIDPSRDYEDVLLIAEHANYRLIEERLIRPALAGQIPSPLAADAVASARTAALLDPEGEGLAKCLAEIEGQSAFRIAAE